MAGLPDDCVDLALFSPPYEAARSYSIAFNLRGQDWVDWMVRVFVQARRVCKGLVACVCEGQTRGYSWSAAPVLLMADLKRAGFVLRKPPTFCRVGIPGSGGPDWWRNDYEFIVCTTRGGKLPWSDNTACGKPPTWAPGGEMSYRLLDGTRVDKVRVTTETAKAAGKSARQMARDQGDKLKHSTSGTDDGGLIVQATYVPPKIANPGNLIKCKVQAQA